MISAKDAKKIFEESTNISEKLLNKLSSRIEELSKKGISFLAINQQNFDSELAVNFKEKSIKLIKILEEEGYEVKYFKAVNKSTDFEDYTELEKIEIRWGA